MTTVFELAVPRSAADVPRLYVEARVAGLEVTHSRQRKCVTYDGLPVGALGVFRHVGLLYFHKADRRWEVHANIDCGPVDLATLLRAGLHAVERYGRAPGGFTRRRYFEHFESKRSGPMCGARVSYKLNADDLMAPESTVAVTSTPVDVSALLGASG